MAASAEWLATQLQAGRATHDLARCTGDEINVHLGLIKTEIVLDSLRTGDSPDEHDRVLVALLALNHRDGSGDWMEDAKTCLLRDVDVEMLWQPEYDGIEDDEEMGERFDLTYLRVTEWFEPFSDVAVGPGVPHPTHTSWRRGPLWN